MRPGPRAAWLLLAALGMAPVWADTPEAWLDRMAHALGATDYQGTLVYIEGGQIETLQVFHSASERRERVVALTGQPRELVRDGDRITCIGTAPAPLVFDGGSLAGLKPIAEVGRDGPGSDYLATMGEGGERIAGRPTVAVELRPRDAYRYGYRLWLDRDSALPLRVALFDAGGEALEQLTFTEVDVGRAPDPEDLRLAGPPPPPETAGPASLAAEVEIEAGWSVRDLPAGFRLRRHQQQADGEHLVFTDGLAAVSVYIESLDSAPAVADKATRAGAVHARSVSREGRRIVAIGKVPAATVDRFVRGATPPSPEETPPPAVGRPGG